MQNFIKTIINAVQAWTSKKIKDSTADWNQNDPNADNYVKNRTHWEEEAVIIAEREISGFSLMQEPLYAVENPFRMSPVVGSTYTVVWDGVSYDVKMQSFDGLGYIGNVNYVNMASGGNIPFAIVFAEDVFLVTESPAASHTISISGAVVHKLDSKYLDLPTNLATTDDVQEAVDVANEAHNIANSKMKANNPVGTGSFSMNRKSGTTIGDFSHAEGYYTTASGSNSHAEGYYTTASGSNSHAEGYYTTAFGRYSHAEGSETTASGRYSHAEGSETTASGFYSHAEGSETTASGRYSHAEGSGTRAIGDSSHAEGKFNISDTTKTYAHIVGNGASNTARSNAHALDWEGNAWYQGDVYVGSTSGTNKDEGSKKLATEEYVDTALEDLSASGGFVVQAEPPEDKSLLWVDIDDDSEEAGGNVDLTGYATEQYVQDYAQPKGNYLTEHQDISGKLDASALPTAINTALAQAKASGDFDGKDGPKGDSVSSVKQTTTSDADGGLNVVEVTLSNNETFVFTVRNGSKGSTGATGPTGPAGQNGTSVTVASVSESAADGGSNVVTFSDGKKVNIKNGVNGKDGKTPVRGTDYFTEADINEIVNAVYTKVADGNGVAY